MRNRSSRSLGTAPESGQGISQENVELVMRLVRSWNEPDPDPDSVRALLHPEFEYHGRVEWPGVGRIVRGFEGMWRRRLALKSDLGELRIEPLELIEAGDSVVLIAEMNAVGRRSGVPLHFTEAFICTMRDGRVARVEVCGTRERALEAARQRHRTTLLGGASGTLARTVCQACGQAAAMALFAPSPTATSAEGGADVPPAKVPP